ncbi:phage protein Gp36 family protein [Acinetobacter vivianii]
MPKLMRAINAANSEIDGYMTRYPQPLKVIPPSLQMTGCDLARYHACIGNAVMSEEIEKRYDKGVKNLEKLSKGLTSLGGSPAGESKPLPSSKIAWYSMWVDAILEGIAGEF